MSGGILAGKVALVTGVSSGLGRAVAIAYVQAGAAVLGVARRRELGEDLRAELGTDRFALGPMRQRGGGVILNIASNTAEIALRQMAPYASAKAALVQLTRATAVEYFEDNIRANAILLGGTATGQQHRSAAAKQATPEERERASAVS